MALDGTEDDILWQEDSKDEGRQDDGNEEEDLSYINDDSYFEFLGFK